MEIINNLDKDKNLIDDSNHKEGIEMWKYFLGMHSILIWNARV